MMIHVIQTTNTSPFCLGTVTTTVWTVAELGNFHSLPSGSSDWVVLAGMLETSPQNC